MVRFTLGSILILVVAPTAAGQPPEAPPPRELPVAEWVRQLGNPDVSVRDRAAARLSALTAGPPSELLAAMRSDDPDVRARATRAVAAVRTTVALARGRRFAEQGRVDLFVAATATWDLPADDPQLWELAHALGRRLIDRTMFIRDNQPHNCPSSYADFATYKRLHFPLFTRSDQSFVQPDPQREVPPRLFRRHAVQAPGITAPTGVVNSIFVSRGEFETLSGIQESLVYATGDVSAVTVMSSCIVVCDGDVTVAARSISRSVVVARGNITIQGWPYKSYLAAGGKVTRGMRPNVNDRSEVVEDAKGALGVTFFELTDVGVSVRPAAGSVAVEIVAADGAFARAGVRTGDVILTVNGRRPESAESLRRLLRDAFGPGDAAVRIRRGAEIIAVTVCFPA
ncbi:MAG: PDZ domain-containing protein [Gemmataceae bacterium]